MDIFLKTAISSERLLSLLMFNIALDWVMHVVNNNRRGINWVLLDTVEDIDYTDDICLLSSIKDYSTKLLSCWNKFGNLPVNLGLLTEFKIFNTKVKTVLLYTCKSWKCTKEGEQHFQTFANKCLWWICASTGQTISQMRSYYIAPAKISLPMKPSSESGDGLDMYCRKSQITKQALEWNPQGQWRKGCPSITWRRTIQTKVHQASKTWN